MERNAGGQVLSPKNTATTVGHAGPLAGAGRATQLLDPLRHHSSAAESIFRPQAPSGPSENDVQPGLPITMSMELNVSQETQRAHERELALVRIVEGFRTGALASSRVALQVHCALSALLLVLPTTAVVLSESFSASRNWAHRWDSNTYLDPARVAPAVAMVVVVLIECTSYAAAFVGLTLRSTYHAATRVYPFVASGVVVASSLLYLLGVSAMSSSEVQGVWGMQRPAEIGVLMAVVFGSTAGVLQAVRPTPVLLTSSMFLVASEALLASRAHTDAAGAAVARIAVCLPIYLALSYWMRFCVDPSFTGPFMAPVAAGLRWVLRRVGGHRLGEKMAGDTTKVVILLALSACFSPLCLATLGATLFWSACAGSVSGNLFISTVSLGYLVLFGALGVGIEMSRILVASREAVIENIVPKEVGQALIQSRISARHVDADDWRRAPTGRASTSMETRTARKSLDARDVDLAAEASSPRARMWRKGPSSRVGPSRASEDTHASAANVLANRRIATPARAATTRTAQALLGPGHGEAATTPGTPQPPPVQLRLVTPPFQASEAHAADGPPQQGVWKNILAPVMRRTACEDPVSPSAGMRQRRPSPLVLPAPDLSDMSRPRTPLGIQSTALDGMQGGAVVLPYYRDFEDVGMLFSDVVGFTSMSAQLPPKRILLLLHQCFSAIDKCVRHLGAFKYETVGDAYVAAANIFREDPTHSMTLLKLGVTLIKLMASVRIPMPDGSTHQLSARVGIHRGPCSGGVLGLERSVLQLVGDTLNTASRMESTGQPNCVQVTGDVFDALPAHIQALFVDRVVVAEGKGEMKTHLLDVLNHPEVPASGLSLIDDPETWSDILALPDRV